MKKEGEGRREKKIRICREKRGKEKDERRRNMKNAMTKAGRKNDGGEGGRRRTKKRLILLLFEFIVLKSRFDFCFVFNI